MTDGQLDPQTMWEAQPGREQDEDVASITDLFDAFLEGWNRGSGPAFAAGFTDPCDFVAFDGTHLRTRDEIERVHQELFDTWLRGTRLTGTPQVRMLTPDAALVVASGDTIMRGKQAPAPERASIQTLVAVRRDHRWRFASFHNTRVRLIGQNRRSALVWLLTDKLWKLLGGRQTHLDLEPGETRSQAAPRIKTAHEGRIRCP